MEGTIYNTKEAVLRRAQEAIGIPMRDIDKTGRIKTGKGAIGTVLEESWFGYTPNSEAEPDFPEAGVELKATPYIRNKNGIRAKERLVCNIINYHCCKVITNKPKKIAPGCPAKSVRRKSQESDMRVRFYQRPCLSGSGSPGLTPLRGLL